MAISKLVEQLQDLIVRLRSQLEQSEAHIPIVNSAIRRLAELDLVTSQTLLGNVVHTQSYSPESGITDSGLVIQAALKIPEGLGVVTWDSERYMTLRQSPEGLESEAILRFTPYDELEPALKALLLAETPVLTERFLRLSKPIG
ncbi:MAG: hypothetical protein R3C03_04390 [Pirellulaceae bacterium]